LCSSDVRNVISINFSLWGIIITNTRGITPLQKEVELLARQPKIGMPLVSSLAAREIATKGSASKGTIHGGGFVAWGKAASTKKKREKACRL